MSELCCTKSHMTHLGLGPAVAVIESREFGLGLSTLPDWALTHHTKGGESIIIKDGRQQE